MVIHSSQEKKRKKEKRASYFGRIYTGTTKHRNPNNGWTNPESELRTIKSSGSLKSSQPSESN